MNDDKEKKCNTSTNEDHNANPKKKKLRGKDLYKIKEQMEFYFSHANLRRDRFLGNLVRSSVDGYVHLAIFLTFNQIKKFTQDVNDIIKAVSDSNKLEISSDKKKIRVKCQEESTFNYDECTVYVERLPQNSDHQYVRNIFNRFGNIAYISLPRFRHSNKIKGFAFVEFEKPDSAKQACEAYKSNNESSMESNDREITKQDLTPKKKSVDFSSIKNKELSPQKFQRKRKYNESEKKASEKASIAICDTEKTKVDHEESEIKKNKKRKHHDSENDSCENKKLKTKDSCPELETIKPDDLNESLEKRRKRKITETEDDKIENLDIKHNTEALTKEIEETAINDVKKIKLEEKNEQDIKEKNEESVDSKNKKRKKKNNEKLKLRVLLKADWKQYRNKYLSMQKRTMSAIKRLLLLTKRQQAECEAMLSKSDENVEESASEVTESVPKSTTTEFQPGVIIKLALNKIVNGSSDFIKSVKSKVDVAFVDVIQDKPEAFIRFHDSTSLKEALNNNVLQSFGVAELVTGEQETAYWEKLRKDKETQLARPKTNKRGRDKILTKASSLMKQKSTHIYFEDSF